ncbi:hypothetical protein AO726_17155 [Pseudomonas sp. TTU2014-080ASC]|nr:hypothetical protein AO726_17155 [Pseudomonas sp. TTU2014-080ASC]
MTTFLSTTYLNQSDVALQVESLVEAICGCDSPAFRIKGRTQSIASTRLSRYFKHIQQMVDLVMADADYSFSEHLEAFRDACHDIGLESGADGPVCLNDAGTAYLDHHSSMNLLVDQIRRVVNKRRYKRTAIERRSLARKQALRAAEYVNAITDRYSRTTVVRMDYHYKTEAQGRLRIEHVFEDLDLLISEHRRNPIFDHLIGYIYAVEQGDRADGSGYHIHALYLFNGNQVCRDVFKAQQLGQLWQDITQRQGRSHSSNFDKEGFAEDCGIGRLERSDRCAREVLQKVARYLVKNGQHLRLKPARAKALRIGRF